MEGRGVPRISVLLIVCIAFGLGIGTLAGFLVGLLRPHATAGYTPAYVPPPSAEDKSISVERPAGLDA
ncbi:MAG: hypothetical protein ABWZ26_04595 [Candidatus Nanopelagicales bacterium]